MERGPHVGKGLVQLLDLGSKGLLLLLELNVGAFEDGELLDDLVRLLLDKLRRATSGVSCGPPVRSKGLETDLGVAVDAVIRVLELFDLLSRSSLRLRLLLKLFVGLVLRFKSASRNPLRSKEVLTTCSW